MNKYSSYKDSELFWFKSVPKHWVKTKNKFVLVEKDERVNENSNDYKLLSLTKKGIILRDIESGKGKFPESFDTYKIVTKGDVIFCLYDIEETPRTVGFSELNGMISGSYKIFGFTEKMIGKYFYYYFLHVDDEKGLKPYYTGLRNVVRPETFKSLDFFSPPLSEQQQIVTFLDDKTQKIDSLIQQKQKKIKLLKEKRTSLINHFVTKGLDTNVVMKDSGVEWIGEIPSEWIMSKFKFDTLNPVQYGINISSDKYVDEGIRFVRITDINEDGSLKPNNGRYLISEDVPEEFLLNKYDVLFCRSGHTVGKSYLHTSEGVFTSGGYLVRFNFRNYFESKFIFYLSKTHFYWDWIKLNTVVSTIENVNGDKYQNFIYPKPPINEQQQIVEYMDKQTEEIDTLIQLEQKKIDTLKEYRQSLISEVVTGKIRVCKEDNSLSLNSQIV
jgi:type I restriction enzyme S subunit